jgi:Xaa-Pro dipeptidase
MAIEMRGPRSALRGAVFAAACIVAAAQPAGAQPPRAQSSFDVESAQAILAVQGLDGWLLAQSAPPNPPNPVAVELVAPAGQTAQAWFYLILASGEPVALVHESDAAAFQGVAGRVVPYADERALKAALRTALKGVRRVAMEYAPRSRIAALTRVDAATVALVRAAGAKVSSSAELVQFTKSLWGPNGRVAHYVAIHHLARIKDAALAHLAAELRAGRAVTELDLQRFVTRAFEVRGLEGPPPMIAAGANTATPTYAPSAERAASIKRGDLVLLDLAARLADAPRPIYARLAWVAYVGDAVPTRYADVFRTVVSARDAAVKLVEDRTARKRVVKGFEADRKARAVIAQAKLADKFVHPTGHSLDTSLRGDGANLDDYESRDTRNLVMGSGFTIGPGVYMRGDFGVRSVVDVYVGRKGLEVTSPAQQSITAVLAP